MWILTLCAFPPLFPSTIISLKEPGLVLKTTFEAPVEKNYPLILEFYFPTEEERGNDTIVGQGYNEYCKSENRQYEIIEKHREYYGKAIPIKVVVKKIPDSTIVIDKTFQTLCTTGHDGHTKKDRDIGYLGLAQGQYLIEVFNISSQPELKGIQTKIMLAGGHGK